MGIIYFIVGIPVMLGGLFGIGFSLYGYYKSTHKTSVEKIWWTMCGSLALLATLAGISLCSLGG